MTVDEIVGPGQFGTWRVTTSMGDIATIVLTPERCMIHGEWTPLTRSRHGLPQIGPSALRSLVCKVGQPLIWTTHGGVGGVDEWRVGEVIRIERGES